MSIFHCIQNSLNNFVIIQNSTKLFPQFKFYIMKEYYSKKINFYNKFLVWYIEAFCLKSIEMNSIRRQKITQKDLNTCGLNLFLLQDPLIKPKHFA